MRSSNVYQCCSLAAKDKNVIHDHVLLPVSFIFQTNNTRKARSMIRRSAAMVALLMIASVSLAGCTLLTNPSQNATSSTQPEASAVERPSTTATTAPERVILFADSTDPSRAQMVATTAKLPWHVEVHYIDKDLYWANVARFRYSVTQKPTLTVILHEGAFEHTDFRNIIGVHSADEIIAEVDANFGS